MTAISISQCIGVSNYHAVFFKYIATPVFMGVPGGSDGKESACNVGDLGSIPGMERYPGEGNGNPLQYPCLENPYGQKSLGSYSPWGPKEKDTTG